MKTIDNPNNNIQACFCPIFSVSFFSFVFFFLTSSSSFV
uniref:Uncharacterized protein n=1 Tax=Rhizophora mucronata TaxID=61149 RepID=A0A2P2MUY7_RHIMU